MKTFALALCALATLTGVRATAFGANDMPVCHVDSAGRTVVHYTEEHPKHQSFLCTHQGGSCGCTTHPTHTTSCRQMHHTDGSKHIISGDCTSPVKPAFTWTNIGQNGYCRGAPNGGGFTTYQMGVTGLDATRVKCRAKCESVPNCVAIEANSSGGCEVWYSLPTYGSGASAGRCDVITRPAPTTTPPPPTPAPTQKPKPAFTWTNIGQGYCRLNGGSTGGAGDFTTYNMGVTGLDETRVKCRAKCESVSNCVAIEANAWGGCEVWHKVPNYGSGASTGKCDRLTRQ